MYLEKVVNEVFEDFTFPMVRTMGFINGHNYYEEDGKIIVEVNAAGIKKKDIDLSVEDNKIRVKSEKMHKVINLPAKADLDNITASHTDGLLKITIPLDTKKHKIKIK